MKKSLVLFFFVTLLFACQAAFADGGSITNNRYNESLSGGKGPEGPAGPTGPAGPAGPTGAAGSFASSYGQLSVSSSQNISISSANTWVAIPFNAFGLSSNMDGSTSPPATITVLETGIYQINVSLYFSSEDSPESTFTQTTYTLGMNIDGGATTACADVYAGEPGFFSINYSTIVSLASSSTIQFFIEASAVGGGGPFDNQIALVHGNAYLVQIAN